MDLEKKNDKATHVNNNSACTMFLNMSFFKLYFRSHYHNANGWKSDEG